MKTGMFHADAAGNIPVLVIFAPTATGKTDLVYRLFARDSDSPLAGRAEIISADSMQVYKGMDIGTAKPDASFLSKLPHRMIDLCTPDVQFGSGEFNALADRYCREIIAEGKLPVICGGTAFYIKNFVYGLPDTPEADEETRNLVAHRMETEGAEVLWNELKERDPESAAKIHIHDEYRIRRALEVCISTGKKRSDFGQQDTPRSGYACTVLSLERPREELYQRIDMRVDMMMAAGLPEEFDRLAAAGYTKDDPGMQAIGYREFFMVPEENGQRNLEAVARMIKHDTHRYAKRQETFIKTMACARGIAADDRDAVWTALQTIAGSGFYG
ncbi:MAG: tRNA (adenosine(37)-N6)-dimethylallyltransferase MiaA [Treponemataceae bacterium]|nr:tRNA (adenosine(37)-N6)-dimethylallyltransferase MiaA [Treponemataceae bacterium]